MTAEGPTAEDRERWEWEAAIDVEFQMRADRDWDERNIPWEDE